MNRARLITHVRAGSKRNSDLPSDRKMITVTGLLFRKFFFLKKNVITFFRGPAMELNRLRGNLCTIAGIVLFCGTAINVRFFFFAQHSPTSVVFLTIHDTLLTARGRRFSLFLSYAFFFAMVSNDVDTMRVFAQCSECQRVHNFKQARTNGSHVGLKPVLFVTQPKLRIMCLHVPHQFHRLHVV